MFSFVPWLNFSAGMSSINTSFIGILFLTVIKCYWITQTLKQTAVLAFMWKLYELLNLTLRSTSAQHLGQSDMRRQNHYFSTVTQLVEAHMHEVSTLLSQETYVPPTLSGSDEVWQTCRILKGCILPPVVIFSSLQVCYSQWPVILQKHSKLD